MKCEASYCVKLQATRSYLLPCEGGYLLIDTAYNNDYKRFMRALEKLGFRLSDIQFILLTHHHDDHAGIATRLANECDARIITHEMEVGPLENGENELPPPLNSRSKIIYYIGKLSGGMTSFPPVILRDEDLVVSGDDDLLLRNIGIEGKVLCTPGHTKGSISVLLDGGNAFVGDLASNAFKFTGTKHRPFFIDSMDDLFESWKKILDEGSKTIYPVHGKPFPAEHLQNYMSKHKIT